MNCGGALVLLVGTCTLVVTVWIWAKSKENKKQLEKLAIYESDFAWWAKTLSYLLKTRLHQVLWEKISDEIKEGIHAGHLVILLSLSKIRFQLGVARMDEQH